LDARPATEGEIKAMSWLRDLDPAVVGALIPIVAILGGFAFAITKAIIRHRERLAMIERGMHPDAPPPREKSDKDRADAAK
jgi:hypothetical protein